jgi:hypothetical protein
MGRRYNILALNLVVRIVRERKLRRIHGWGLYKDWRNMG